jgi:excisionase family DNA binding protein
MTYVVDPGEGREGWLGIPQVARLLGVTPTTVYRLVNTGQLRGYRIGRMIRVRHVDLEGYLRSVQIEPGALDHHVGLAPADRHGR